MTALIRGTPESPQAWALRRQLATKETLPSIEGNMALLWHIVSSMMPYAPKVPLDETEEYSIACVAMVEAQQSYIKEKGKFSTWAWLKIEQALIHYYRNKKREVKVVSIELVSGNELVCEDQTNPETETYLKILLADKNDSPIEKRNKEMLVDHFVNGLSQTAIAKKHNLTRMAVSLAIHQIIEKIRVRNQGLIDEGCND